MPDFRSLKAWREEIGRHLLKLDFVPEEEHLFFAKLMPVFEYQDVRVTGVAMCAGTTSRDSALAAEGPPTYAIVIAGRQPIQVSHGSGDFRLPAGSATVMRNWKPGKMASRSGLAYRAIVLPESDLATSHFAAERACGRPIVRSKSVLPLLRSYVRLLEKSGPINDLARSEVRRHLGELARLLIGPNHADESIGDDSDIGDVRLRTILDFLDTHHADPYLTVARAASSAGVSVRYLEHLLERGGQTYTSIVREHRLQHAKSLLDDPAKRTMRIVDIALGSGFSDLSHFNRLYRRRFGEAPSQSRQER
jgi:AraC-like DNA-binding protein